MIETKNAKITNVELSNDDHGVLSGWVYLDYGGSGQGFGGYNLYNPNYKKTDKNIAGHFIWRVMEIVGVHKWSDLKGKNIRVQCDMSHVEAIGNIIEDIWFYPQKEFEEIIGKNQ